MTQLRRLAPLAAVVVAGCIAGQSAPVPLSGEPAALDQLAGEWAGSYENPLVGRAGSIVFTLTAGEDHAHGDVVLVAANAVEPYRPMPPMTIERAAPATASALLTIEFVRIRGDSVSGRIAPYFDPACDCTTVARFKGHLAGDRITGVFEARQQGGRLLRGTWAVRRRAP